MKKLKTLFIQFENEIPAAQISAFRGAVIEKVGKEYILFHHHQSNDTYLYQYPLIQYKSIGKKASIVCLGDGVEDIHKLFEHKKWDINLQDEKIILTINKLNLNTINLNIWDKPFDYYLNNWLALNKENFEKYQKLESLVDKCLFLEKVLVGNILSFAKGMEWIVEKPIVAKISDIKKMKIIRYKGVPLAAFDIAFNCNVFLPNYIGLGKSASHGFGIVSIKRKEPSSI